MRGARGGVPTNGTRYVTLQHFHDGTHADTTTAEEVVASPRTLDGLVRAAPARVGLARLHELCRTLDGLEAAAARAVTATMLTDRTRNEQSRITLVTLRGNAMSRRRA